MHHVVAMLLGTPSQLDASTVDNSVSLVELLLPVAGWVILTVGVLVRFKRHPRSISA